MSKIVDTETVKLFRCMECEVKFDKQFAYIDFESNSPECPRCGSTLTEKFSIPPTSTAYKKKGFYKKDVSANS